MKLVIAFICSVLAATAVVGQDYALTAPDSAHSRQQIEVGWTAPQEDGGLLEIRFELNTTSRSNYAYVRNNPQGIEAPEAPGDYVIVFIHEREVKASRPLTVYRPEASLTAPASVGAREDFQVTWSGPNARSDNITFAARGGAMIRGTSYAYVGNSKDGTVSLRAPADAGDYDLIYLSGTTVLARAPVTVGAVSATLRVPSKVHAGGQLRVAWEGPRNAQDYIGFAERDGDYIRGTNYKYVGNFEDNVVVLHAREEVGPVDVVYITGDRIIGRSPVDIIEPAMAIDAPAEVTALDRFAVRWAGTANSGDQIRMIDNGGELLAYRYVDPDDALAPLVAPVDDGDFNLVYITREGRELARRGITVLPAAELPGTLTVVQSRPGLGPDDAIAVIFDASGSMLQRMNGVRRVEIARDTLTRLVADTLPAETGFVLRVFGHREAGSCRTDLEIPLAPLDRGRASAMINTIEAMNLARTPLARSIELTAGDLAGVSGQRIVVLLTDGEETCDGDPAAAIAALRAKGWDIRVNIVGFAIDDLALRETFAAWAALGGGAYFNASDRDELGVALVDAVAIDFTVVNAEDDSVARGRVGDTLNLPAGNYSVHWAGRQTPAVVPSGSGVTVTLE